MHTCMASLLLVCLLVERVVRVPSGWVKHQKRYFVSFLEINDAMRINSLFTILVTFGDVSQVHMCLNSNKNDYFRVLNRSEGLIPFTPAPFRNERRVMSDRIRGLLHENSGIRTFQQALQDSCTDVGGDFITVLQVRMHFLPHIDRGFPNPLTQFSLDRDPAGSRVDRQRGV